MSELINNSQERKKKLKELILKLHEGENQEKVGEELTSTLSKVPYNEVVEVEEELIAEGLPVEEVLKLCDIHASVLTGHIDLSSSKEIIQGHPVILLSMKIKSL